MIIAENISKSYGTLQVLKNVSLTINKSEIVSIVGVSGAGKTTLLQILGTLQHPDKGTVIIDGVNVHKLKDIALSKFRNRKIGFVFQFHHLLPEFTALENICIPGYISGKSKNEVEKKAKELCEFMNIEHRMDHKPHELSGGENQRVAIARALINNPEVIFADEPSGNLDSANTQELFSLILSLREHFSQTFVIVTHNSDLSGISDKVFHMADGKIEREHVMNEQTQLKF
ncbi:MAG TPA: ABC transporter ATP-binding protein [Bacteroidales bacterium]|jgi:lipoprotein-releasing system ATP-binding protein|nr:ABC transporter ATP-binding protein [Bacteroidales bacterium]HOU98496.1 ABC transporter ATP-binding protein [Bacteroidales bacterium]